MINYVGCFFLHPRGKFSEDEGEQLLIDHLNYLKQLRTTIVSQYTFVINHGGPLTVELLALISKTYVLNCVPVKWILRPNVAISYGAFVSSYFRETKEFDWWFFIEDDYVPCINDWDSRLVDVANKLNADYLCGLAITRKSYIEAAVSNGLIKKSLMNDVFGPLKAEGFLDAEQVKSLQTMSQTEFSKFMSNDGSSKRIITDWTNTYKTQFFEGMTKPKKLKRFSRPDVSVDVIVPIQLLRNGCDDCTVIDVNTTSPSTELRTYASVNVEPTVVLETSNIDSILDESFHSLSNEIRYVISGDESNDSFKQTWANKLTIRTLRSSSESLDLLNMIINEKINCDWYVFTTSKNYINVQNMKKMLHEQRLTLPVVLSEFKRTNIDSDKIIDRKGNPKNSSSFSVLAPRLPSSIVINGYCMLLLKAFLIENIDIPMTMNIDTTLGIWFSLLSEEPTLISDARLDRSDRTIDYYHDRLSSGDKVSVFLNSEQNVNTLHSKLTEQKA